MSEKSQEIDTKQRQDNIINKDKNSLRNDIIYFKEELLKQMNILEKSFSQQKEEIRAKINGKFILYDETIEKLNTEFSQLKNLAETNKYLKVQVDDLFHFKKDISKLSTNNNVKLTLLEKDTNNNFYRIDKLLSNSIIYPRILGKNARFKNFHEFIDYILEKISSFDIFKSKIILDIQSYKEKVDKIIQTLKIRLDCCINDSRQIVKNGIKENEIIMKDYITGKIYDLQVKNKEFEKKFEKNLDEFNLGKNTFDEKIKLIDEKIEEKLTKEKFSEEKNSIYNDINKCKDKDNELNKRINELEKYKLTQEKKDFWPMKTFKQRQKGNNMNLNLGLDFLDFSNLENFKNIANMEIQENEQNNTNIQNNNQLKLNLGDETNRLGSINESEDKTDELDNDKAVELNKVIIDKNIIASEEDNNKILKNNIRKNSKKIAKTMRPLYKLKVSLKDINAQFNLESLNTKGTNNSLKDNYTQSLPMTVPIFNKYIDFNELLSFSFKNRLKYLFKPRTRRNSVSIKNKEIKFLDDDEIEPKKVRNYDFITEGPLIKKEKNKKSEESKKAWERLLSPKMKLKSNLNILDTNFVNFRNMNKNKTLNKMKISRSSKNFFSSFFKS